MLDCETKSQADKQKIFQCGISWGRGGNQYGTRPRVSNLTRVQGVGWNTAATESSYKST
jgi:hypothetical protein